MSNGIKNIALLTLFVLLSYFLVHTLYTNFHKAASDERQKYLQQVLVRTVIDFQDEMDKYGLLVTSLRSHIISIGRVPNEVEMQKHIINQLKYSEYAHSILLNYIDENHTFVYSISEKELTPNDLRGQNVADIRDTSIVNKLNYLLTVDDLVAFAPLNILEGFIGLPLNFRVIFNSEVQGYIAPLIDIKNIVNPIFEKDINHEFTYRFSYGDDIVFDREQVYDNTKVFHNRVDSLNLKLSKEQYLDSDIEAFGMNFNLGVAYRNDQTDNYLVSFMNTSWGIILGLMALLALVSILMLQLIDRSRQIKTSLVQISSMNEVLKKLNAAISLELRNLVDSMKDQLDSFQLSDNNKLSEGEKKQILGISNNVDQMNMIITDVLSYKEIISNENKKETINLNEIVEDIKLIYADRGAKIFNEPLPRIIGDKSQINQLFKNLISNAIKFNESEDPTVIISTNILENHNEIRISDNGIGVKPEYLTSIFEDFKRRNKSQYPGTGLGLGLCKEIVRNHGGEIKAEENSLGGLDIIFLLHRTKEK